MSKSVEVSMVDVAQHLRDALEVRGFSVDGVKAVGANPAASNLVQKMEKCTRYIGTGWINTNRITLEYLEYSDGKRLVTDVVEGGPWEV